MGLVSSRIRVAFWERWVTEQGDEDVFLVLKPPTQGKDNMPLVLNEVSRCFFPFSFPEIDVDQYSVIEFSEFLFI